jgi:hypothetical protein
MFKLSRIRWMGYVAHMGEMRNSYEILDGKRKGKGHLSGRDVDGWIILKLI